MKRFRLAIWATLPAVLLAVGCATNSCNSCNGRGSFWQRFGTRSHRGCPCECEGGFPVPGGSPVLSDGPILGDPGLPPPAPPPTNLGAPTGVPVVPAPLPNSATTVPAQPSSRTRK